MRSFLPLRHKDTKKNRLKTKIFLFVPLCLSGKFLVLAGIKGGLSV